MSMQHAQYVLLFVVLVVNSNWFQHAACPVCVTICSTGGKFQPVSNFTVLHALTLAARSCALLCTRNLPKIGPPSKTSHCPFLNEVVAKNVFLSKVHPPTVHAVMREAWKKQKCARGGTSK